MRRVTPALSMAAVPSLTGAVAAPANASPASHADPYARAAAQLEAHPSAARHTAAQTFTPAGLVTDRDGSRHVRLHGNAAAVWYRALTVYMTSNTDHHAARTATLTAAADLYGAGSTEYAAVNAAWAAVGVT